MEASGLCLHYHIIMRLRYWLGAAIVLVGISYALRTDAGGFLWSGQEPAPPKAKPTYNVPKRCADIVDLVLQETSNPSWALAQIDQESNCNPYAVSHVGALGLVQIMPENLEWLEYSVCADLGEAQPNNPDWAVPCYERFMQWFTVDEFDSYCPNLHVDSMRYNGGFYIIWELRTALSRLGVLSFKAAEQVCGTRLDNGRKRSKASCDENYDYPARIGYRQEKYYSELGGQMCPFNYKR